MDDNVVFNGENVSLSSICERFDVDIDCVRVYIKNGFTPEESIKILLDVKKFDQVYKSSVSRYKTYEYQGEKGAISYFCTKYNLDPTLMTHFLAESDSFEEAVDKYHEAIALAAEENSVDFNGSTAPIHEVAKQLGIRYPSLYQNKKRSGKDYSLLLQEELDLDELLQKHIEIDGFSGSINELIEKYDLDKSNILRRYMPHNNAAGMDIVSVVTGTYYLKKIEDKVFTVCGVRGNYKTICEKLNISTSRITHKFYTADPSAMESDSLAILKASISREHRHISTVNTIYELNGVKGTVRELCDRFNMNYRAVVTVIIRSSLPVQQVLQDEYDWAVLLDKKFRLPGFRGTLKECIVFLGVPTTKVKKRIQSGEPPQKVLSSIYDSLN